MRTWEGGEPPSTFPPQPRRCGGIWVFCELGRTVFQFGEEIEGDLAVVRAVYDIVSIQHFRGFSIFIH